jgi:hypothetical protein
VVNLDRRQLLALVPVFVALACQRKPSLTLPPEYARESARVIGQAWLDKQLIDPSPRSIIEDLTRGVSTEDRRALDKHLMQRHLDDLATGRTESVDGWVLSATEVKLYALVALS